jgi:hypothetical protein
MAKTDTCLQINMAPNDLRHIVHTLPHQLRMLGGQVSEIQFTLDNHHSRAGRYATDKYAEKHAELRRYLEQTCSDFPHASIVDVDYSPESLTEVAQTYIGVKTAPIKAYDGSPIHAYLYGVLRARRKYVFHIDSDMLFGGGSQTWFSEAVNVIERNPDVRACAPLDGPPSADGFLKSAGAVACNLERVAYSWNRIGTRVFMIDRERFLSGDDRIPLVRATGIKALKSYFYNTSGYLPLEECMSEFMGRNAIRRVDFLGSGNGMWQLHPPYRSERFFAELPELIRRVEANDIPEAQRGDHNVNDSMIDWSDVRRRASFWRKVRREARMVAINMADRVRSS